MPAVWLSVVGFGILRAPGMGAQHTHAAATGALGTLEGAVPNDPPIEAGPVPGPSLVRRALPAILLTSRALVEVVGRVPRPLGHALTAAVSVPLRRLTWKRCRSNLDAFFGPLGWSEAERERLFRAHQRYMVRMRLEAARIVSGPRAEVGRVAEVEGEEHLRAALAGGQGVLLVGAHEGTWWHVPMRLARDGFDVRSVFNSFPGAGTDAFLVRRARSRGLQLSIVDHGAAEQFRACARENGVFYIAFDVAIKPPLATPFPFGPVRLPIERAPAILAARLGMPVLLAECEHLPQGRSAIRIRPPLAAPPSAVARADALCRAWIASLEARVLARPEQWWAWGFIDLLPPEPTPARIDQ